MSKKAPPALTDQIRRAVLDSGQTRYTIAKATGIDQAALSRFVHGAGLSMESLDALGEHLGLTVVAKRPAKRSAKKGR